MEGSVAHLEKEPDDEGILARLVIDYSTRREMEKAMMVVDASSFWSGQVIPPFRVTDEGGFMATSRPRVVL